MRRLACIAAFAALGCASAPRARVAGAYRFECTPVDAHVIVDEVDTGPCVLWRQRWLGLTTGEHRVQVVREGYFPQESAVTPNGRRHTVRVHLRRVPD